MTTGQILELIRSQNRFENYYGLIRSRYDRDPQIAAGIEDALLNWKDGPELKDNQRWWAIITLEVLYGRHIGLVGWANLRNDRKIASDFVTPNCKEFAPKTISEIKASDITTLNICIRQKTDRKDYRRILQIEQIGRFSLPFSNHEKKVIAQEFKIK